MSPEAIDILITLLTTVAAVLIAFVAVRYDHEHARRRGAADDLIDWTNETGSLASDAIHAALHYYRTKEDSSERDWGEAERNVRLDYARLSRRLPEDIAEAIREPASDLLTITKVTMPRFPKKQLEAAEFFDPPPEGLFDNPDASHGEWLDSPIDIVGVLEPTQQRESIGNDLDKRRICGMVEHEV